MRGEGYSLSDIAAATGNGNGGFGGDYGAWWIIIIIVLFGWGRGGYGFGGSGSEGAANNYVLASDFATLQRMISDGNNMIERKLDGVNNGLCSLGYQELQNINGVNTNILTTGNTITSQLADVGFAIKDCCCTTQRNIDSVKYENAQNTAAITNTITMNSRDIIDNVNANYRALHDELVNFRIQDKDQQIQAQQNEINALRLSASQSAQNEYLINQIKPCPIPAFITCNPWASNNCGYSGNGCGM